MSNLGKLIRSYKDIEKDINSLSKNSLVDFKVGVEVLKVLEDTPQVVNDAISLTFGEKRPNRNLLSKNLIESKNKIVLILDMIENNENTKDIISLRGGDGTDFNSRKNFLYKELADFYTNIKNNTEEIDKTILLEVDAILTLKPHDKALLNKFIDDIKMLEENKKRSNVS